MMNNLQNRRAFLKATAAAGTIAVIPWSLAAKSRRVGNIGLQLYTLRSEMAQDFEGTLAKVAALGYSEMEFAGYYGKSPKQVRRILDQMGMTSPATHVQLQAIRDNLDNEIETAVAIGQRYIVVPSVPSSERSIEHYHRHAELLNRAGEICRRSGLQMGYHNHSFEFAATGDQNPYDILLTETDPDLVTMELDLFWIYYAGADPNAYFKKYPKRFSMLHVKDMDTQRNMVDVGRGNIDFAELFSYADTAGFKHYFVEHDDPDDGMKSVATSINSLSKLVF